MDLWPMHRAAVAPTFAVATAGEERGLATQAGKAGAMRLVKRITTAVRLLFAMVATGRAHVKW